MTEEELLALLNKPEGVNLEFKKAKDDVPDNVYRTVSAFANTDGGWLIFGISDEGVPHNITGVTPDKVDEVQGAFLSAQSQRAKN